MKKLEYRIVEEGSAYVVASEVGALIAEGWKPLGGVSASLAITSSSSHYWLYAQAMTRETEAEQQP